MAQRPSRRFSLLIGDDDASVRQSVADLVAVRGFRVFTAGSGAESLQILMRSPIDLSILDVHMPDMTGIEVFERFVRGPFIAAPDSAPAPPRQRRLPAIFMSADATPEIRHWCEASGSWFLDKQFAPADMLAAIDDLLSDRAGG